MAGVTADSPAEAVTSDQATSSTTEQKLDSTDNTNTTNVNQKTKDQQDGKKNKPRRERLPLPDPIPETPVKRYPEPKKADLQARVNEEDAKLQACFDRLNSTRAFYDERQKIREEGRPAIDAALKKLTGLNDQCRTMFDQRKTMTTKLKQIRDADMNARASSSNNNELAGAGKDGNEALKNVKTIEELEAKITELKHIQAHSSLALPAEKRLVAQIGFLTTKGRKFIQDKDLAVKKEKVDREARIASRKELEETRKTLDTRIDAIKAEIEAQKKEIDNIRQEQDEKIKVLQDSTSTINRDEEKKKIGEIKAIIKKMRDDFQDELDKWYLNERIHYEQVKIARRKKQEALQAEREARRKKWEEEQAQYPEPHPYQAEKDMCSGLIVYMQTLLGETAGKPTVQLGPQKSGPSLKTTSLCREISKEGKAIGKSSTTTDDGFENLSFGDYVKKSSKGKKGKGRRAQPRDQKDETPNEDVALKPHSIDYITAFTKMDVKPPNKMSEVRTALEAVMAKKDYYETLEPPSEEEKAKKAENKPKKQNTSENKVANGVNITNGDGDAAFPGLSSDSASRVPTSRDSSMPSFMAVASGAAPAPVPAPVPAEDNGDGEHINGDSVIASDAAGADMTGDSAIPAEASATEA